MTENNFQISLKSTARLIDQEIVFYFSIWNKESIHKSSRLKKLTSILEEASIGGKKLRGALIYLAYQMALGRKMSSKEEKAVLQVAVAYELFQTAILAHDDVIDRSFLRRGKPSMYQQLGGDHYGISQTICIGDLGFFMAYKIIAESQFPDGVKTKAMAFFSDAITKTVLGQMLDVSFSEEKQNVEKLEKDIVEVYKLKTAYYTFVGPLSLGATLASADENVLTQAKVFGENVGILFQIHDDIADIFPNRNVSNKDIGADIKEGKMTVLYVKTLQKTNATQRSLLKKYYGRGRVDSAILTEVQKVFKESGGLDEVLELAEFYEEKARKTVSNMTDSKFQQLFSEIVDYVSRKEKQHD